MFKKNRLPLLTLLICIALFSSCFDILTYSRPEASTNAILVSSITEVEKLFPDDEDSDTLQSEKYRFFSHKMLSITPLNEKQFTISNFVPIDLHDITVIASFVGISSSIELLTLDTIMAHTRLTLNYPTTDGQAYFKGTNGEVVVLDPTHGFKTSSIMLDFLPSNEKLQMLKDITIEWECIFNDFFSETEVDRQETTLWRPIRPAQARLYTLLILNTSYLFSQQEYIDRFLDEPLYKYVDRSTRIVADDQWLSNSEKEELYYKKIADKSFRLGITSGGGLGGGSALGVSNSTLTKQFNYKWDDSLLDLEYLPSDYYTGPHPVYSHEMGHCFGYGHSSNMCSTGRKGLHGTGSEEMFGFPAVSVLLHSKYVHYELLPCMKDEYYNQIDFEYKQPDRYAPY